MRNILTFAFCIFVVAAVASNSNNSDRNKTDGVYESAIYKLDHNQPLNAREQQRIDDIMNWCKQCDKPLRMCKHGR